MSAPAGTTSLWRRALVVLLLGTAVAIAIIPIAWMVATSFKSNLEITQETTILPRNPTLESYRRLFADRNFALFLRNSLIVTAGSVAMALAIGSLAAYSIARFRLRWRLERRLGVVLLVVRIVPPVVVLVPVYLLMLRLDLLDSLLGLGVVYTALNVSLVVWMMESFFHEIPVDIEEAAMVDGDSRLGALRRVVLPLAAPGLVATSIFAVIVTFNEFLFALAITSTPGAETVPRGAATLIGRLGTDWGAMSAAGVVAAVPIVAFALLVQRHLVRGLTMGAMK